MNLWALPWHHTVSWSVYGCIALMGVLWFPNQGEGCHGQCANLAPDYSLLLFYGRSTFSWNEGKHQSCPLFWQVGTGSTPPCNLVLSLFFSDMMHPQLLWHLFSITCVVLKLAAIILSSIDDTSEGCAFPAAYGPHQI